MNADKMVLKLQVKEGIDAVIVDNVLAIRKGLTGSDNASAPAKEMLAQANGSINSSSGVVADGHGASKLTMDALDHALP